MTLFPDTDRFPVDVLAVTVTFPIVADADVSLPVRLTLPATIFPVPRARLVPARILLDKFPHAMFPVMDMRAALSKSVTAILPDDIFEVALRLPPDTFPDTDAVVADTVKHVILEVSDIFPALIFPVVRLLVNEPVVALTKLVAMRLPVRTLPVVDTLPIDKLPALKLLVTDILPVPILPVTVTFPMVALLVI
jgi:hypothetical protein